MEYFGASSRNGACLMLTKPPFTTLARCHRESILSQRIALRMDIGLSFL